MITEILDNNTYLDIYKQNYKNTYIGKIRNSNIPPIYGDTYKEVIDQANEIIKEK